MKKLLIVLVLATGCGVAPARIDNLKDRVHSIGLIAEQAQMTASQRVRLHISVERLEEDLEELK